MKKTLILFSLIEDGVSMVLLLITTGIAFLQVLNRYIFHIDVIWLNDLGMYIFVIFMFIAFISCTREDSHIAVEVLPDKLFTNKPPFFRATYMFVLRCVSLITLGMFLTPTYRAAKYAYFHPQYSVLVPWFNESWMMEIMFFALVVGFVYILGMTACDVFRIKDYYKDLKGRP